MNRLLADDYVGISSNGLVEKQAAGAGAAERGDGAHHRLDLTDTRVRVYGDTAS